MSTRIAKEDMARMMPHSIGHYFKDEPAATTGDAPAHRGLVATIAAALRYIVETPRRRAVINELYSLSPHELADIGLTRAEVPMVFDPEFTASRLGAARSTPQAREARRHVYDA